jgi:hypothetical protein
VGESGERLLFWSKGVVERTKWIRKNEKVKNEEDKEGKVALLTVSSSGLPLHLAIASKNLTAARSTGSAGYCHARSSI